MAYERFPDANISEFADFADIIGALKAHKVDATLSVTATARLIERKNPDLRMIPAALREEPTCAAVKQGNTALQDQLNTIITDIHADGTLAGIAMGFTKLQTFIYIVLPQTIQRILPIYKGEFISLVKMTSIVGSVAVQDLMKASDIIRSRTFDAFPTPGWCDQRMPFLHGSATVWSRRNVLSSVNLGHGQILTTSTPVAS